MKQNFLFSVYYVVLTYIKDVFDGTSPYWGTFSFFYNINRQTINN